MEYVKYAANLLHSCFLTLLGDTDSLLSSYTSLLLLHAALELIASIHHRLRPQISSFLYDTVSAFIIIAVANMVGNAVHLQPLRFLAYAYYIMREADCIFSLLEKENHTTPPKVSDLIGRTTKKRKKNSGFSESNSTKSRKNIK